MANEDSPGLTEVVVGWGVQLVPALVNGGVMAFSLLLWANGLRNCGPVRYCSLSPPPPPPFLQVF